MTDASGELVPHHLPGFISGPGETDALFIGVFVFVLLMMLLLGSFYLWLHSLPERMAHGARRTQFEIVAVLALIALFTHNNLFWVAALLLALVQIPDFGAPLRAMAAALEKIAAREPAPDAPPSTAEPQPPAAPLTEHGEVAGGGSGGQSGGEEPRNA